MRRLLALTAALLAVATAALAAPPKAGDAYEIKREVTQETKRPDGGGARSFDRDTLVERVIAVRPDGLELQYDFPKDVPDEARAMEWRFPVRVLKSTAGLPQLLNGAEMEVRRDKWLKTAEIPAAACGQWYFTWNAFRIECDPQSILPVLAIYDLRPADLRDGGLYSDPEGAAPAPLKRTTSGPNGSVFTAELAIAPDLVRHQRAEQDVVVGQIIKKPIALADALNAHASEQISGTITVTLETDAGGEVRKRTRAATLKIVGADGEETTTTTEVVERLALKP